MEQVQQYVAGERNYDKIKGGTGPLVYPGMHVYIYRLLHDLTDQGRDIGLAQIIFAGVYLINEGVVMWCYRLVKVSIIDHSKCCRLRSTSRLVHLCEKKC